MLRIKGDIKQALEKSECSLHAYAIMTNHLHLHATPNSKELLAVFMLYISVQVLSGKGAISPAWLMLMLTCLVYINTLK